MHILPGESSNITTLLHSACNVPQWGQGRGDGVISGPRSPHLIIRQLAISLQTLRIARADRRRSESGKVTPPHSCGRRDIPCSLDDRWVCQDRQIPQASVPPPATTYPTPSPQPPTLPLPTCAYAEEGCISTVAAAKHHTTKEMRTSDSNHQEGR
ncbi:unnamed protein product [Pleuronectes platessa]|uniref:Uncharacterized protein n=1 Tax=Pleuronectes platessa TaxID=8262 RepID=A0A9N7ZCN2_PLEPL|nr:unnamed protein product [Pleuronectes platessa]